MVNQERVTAGIAPLAISDVAVQVAEGWSIHMATANDLAHNDGWFAQDTRDRAGAQAVGENVAYNADLADAHRRLMASPGHRANILDSRFQQVGIGAVKGPTGSWWITEDFMQSRAAANAAATVASTVPPAGAPAPPAVSPPPPASAPTPPAPRPPSTTTGSPTPLVGDAQRDATASPSTASTSIELTPATIAAEAPAVRAADRRSIETASGPLLRVARRPAVTRTVPAGLGGAAAMAVAAVAIATFRLRRRTAFSEESAKTTTP
jgi:hypothetical protein